MINAVLVLLLASLLLTGCQAPTEEAPSEPSANDTTQSTDATLSETETTPLRVITEMEATDFGGRDVHMLVRQQFLYEFSAEETGDIVSDAVYNRNLEIENRFNTKVTCNTEKEPFKVIKTAVTAGTDDYDLVGTYNYQVYHLISAEALMDWLEVPHVNLEKPWHNALANQNATMNTRRYPICSDLSITSMTYTYATFFNIEMMEDYGYSADDLYTLVRDVLCTIYKLSEMVAGM